MNLFKILANGHGTVSETNVSAFLGYLLDPNADHGLGYNFLNLFLEEIITDDNELKKLYKYDYQIFFEQKFKKNKKKEKIEGEKKSKQSEIIDICVLCYETENNSKSMSVMSDFISNNKEIKKVFLIENKIKGTPTTNQLLNQFLAFKEQFFKIKPDFDLSDIHSIYITPENQLFNLEFENNTDIIPNKIHLHWNNEEENNSIKKLLQEILIKEANYEIDPLNEYTKHTIKAFIQFINNDFKSIKEEKSERTNGIKDLHTTTRSLFDKYKDLLDSKYQNIVVDFEDYLREKNYSKITFRHSKTHPIAVFYSGKKIFGLNKKGKKIAIDVVFRSYPSIKEINFSQKVIMHYNNNPNIAVRLLPKTENIEEVIDLFEKILKKINS